MGTATEIAFFLDISKQMASREAAKEGVGIFGGVEVKGDPYFSSNFISLSNAVTQ
jgi:hypothetical protein